MKARYKYLLDHSLSAALGAIEVYNKPTFREREQVFAVLMVVAWEALCKAKLLRDSGNRLTSIYVRTGRRYKKNRAGQYLTIDVTNAAKQCALDPVALENLERLIDIRDAAIHLTADSPALPHLVFTLGLASLRNYSLLLRKWFAVTLDEFDLFILPLGFSYPFQAVTSAALRKEPGEIADIIRQIAKAQGTQKAEVGDFHLAFELQTTLVSAKKLIGEPDILAAVDPTAKSAIVVEKRTRLVDSYPYSFTDLWEKVKSKISGVKQPEVLDVLRDLRMRTDPRYAAYNWRSKRDEARGPKPTTPIIYNEDAVTLVVSEIRRRRSVARAG